MLKVNLTAVAILAVLSAQSPSAFAISAYSLDDVTQVSSEECPTCLPGQTQGASILEGAVTPVKKAAAVVAPEAESAIEEIDAPVAKKEHKNWRKVGHILGKTARIVGHAGTAIGSAVVVAPVVGVTKFGLGFYKGATNDDAKRVAREADRSEQHALAAKDGMSAEEELGFKVKESLQDSPRKLAKGTVGAVGVASGVASAAAVAGTNFVTSAGTVVGAVSGVVCLGAAVHKRPGEIEEGAERTQIEHYCDIDAAIVNTVAGKTAVASDRVGKSAGKGTVIVLKKVGRWFKRTGSKVKDKVQESRKTNQHEESGTELAELRAVPPAALQAMAESDDRQPAFVSDELAKQAAVEPAVGFSEPEETFGVADWGR